MLLARVYSRAGARASERIREREARRKREIGAAVEDALLHDDNHQRKKTQTAASSKPQKGETANSYDGNFRRFPRMKI